jgi:DNA-binding CsgD family transcriptional regulator
VKEIEELHGFSNVTVNSVMLLKQLLTSISPKLIILSFKNNTIEIDKLFKFKNNFLPPILCLNNRHEKLCCVSETTSVIVQSLENTLDNKYLLNNVKSILSIKKSRIKKTIKEKPRSFVSENKNLARYVLELDQKKELLKRMTEKIKELYVSVDYNTKKRLNSILNNIKLDATTNHWDDFKVYFENINPGFISHLSTKYPCLTSKDIKYCCYLKMNMSNEDIRYILGINKESVRTHKYRLKKKMILQKEQDLKKYINSF